MKPYEIKFGDCIESMRAMADNSVDAVVTDPPYGIRFMGKAWDGADIEARATARRSMASKNDDCGPNGGHNSMAAEAGKYDLAPEAMRAFQEFSYEWAREAFRVLKPGGHLLSFSSARTYHRMACGIEDAGFELRDQIMWVYGSGFPKSMNVSKAIDGHVTSGRSDSLALKGVNETRPGEATVRPTSTNGHRGIVGSADAGQSIKRDTPATPQGEQWDGWGTALKPAHEPICVARKPLIGTVAANVLAHGTGALNIDGCRVPHGDQLRAGTGGMPRHDEKTPRGREGDASAERRYTENGGTNFAGTPGPRGGDAAGRWPANLIHDGSDEVLAAFPDAKGQQGRALDDGGTSGNTVYGALRNVTTNPEPRVEIETSAARFFYCAKASKADRGRNTHPTVKPTDLMAYLVRLVTPPGGLVLDPFMGSGSTGKACMREGFRFIGCELDADYVVIAGKRIEQEYLIPKQGSLL